MRPNGEKAAKALAVLVCVLCALTFNATEIVSGKAPGLDEEAITSAICPIVYPADETPGDQGYQYIFFGNAFFINEQGYLITVAHVLTTFRNGGQPHVLVRSATAPPKFLRATLIAADWEHDVAVLRATPNPFDGNYKVSFLPLTAERPERNQSVLAMALRPASSAENAHTFEAPMEERLTGEVFDYKFTQEEEGHKDTELLLFSHAVQRGQSGAPVLSADSQKVIGLVEGQWLRHDNSTFVKTAEQKTVEQKEPSLGAAIRIHYALALLQQHGISWHTAKASEDTNTNLNPLEQTKEFSPPAPLSMVTAPYPPQSLLGGEVLLDARVESSGKLADVKLVKGDPPFAEKAQTAAQSWSFRPAHIDGHTVDARIGVVFQFPQSYVPPLTTRVHNYPEPSGDAAPERSALPTVTVEPEYPPTSIAEGSVVLYVGVDKQGQVTSTRVLRDLEPLTAVTIAAVRQWHFAPAKRVGVAVNSAAVAVVTFRRPAVASRTPPASAHRSSSQ